MEQIQWILRLQKTSPLNSGSVKGEIYLVYGTTVSVDQISNPVKIGATELSSPKLLP